jgi:hypothetical protein
MSAVITINDMRRLPDTPGVRHATCHRGFRGSKRRAMTIPSSAASVMPLT